MMLMHMRSMLLDPTVWVLGVGTQTSLYSEDRGPPSTDDPGASPVRLYRTGPDPQEEDSDRHVSAYPI